MKISLALRIASGLIGVIVVLTLVSLYPVKVAILGVALALYFAANWFESNGK